ncbi:histidine decarboxylase isoform X2 [Tribolium madens]|uniref:histidine decarboxylase isoform X2 n=1 Tax=Tribolium madens TaxID=41895 RepID=UPI001CF741DA|nr:histidine decarboxylase isoform X2 [Tribolium madens]
MDATEYRIRGKELVDYIADYLEDIRERRVFPDKKPGFLRDLIPDSAPVEGETWPRIFADIENVIMPGVTHWQSPHMHAYFPALTSYPSMLGEMLSNAINCVGFTWASSPAATELEMIVMNWLGKMIGLPEDFLHRKNGSGGGVIQTTASEATLISLLAGRWQAIKKYKELYPDAENGEINSKLVAYCSDQAHSSVEKAALIGLVHIRYIECDENLSMRGPELLQTIKKDRELGFIPFWHWQIPLSKRFRALKLWFVIRNYGITGLQKHIREGVRLAQKFEALLQSDSRFEIPAKRHLGLVVFRLVGDNIITETLWKRINSRGNIHCVPAIIKGKYIIRFTVTSQRTTNEDIVKDWEEIRTVATEVLNEWTLGARPRVPLADTKNRNENFGTSLLLSNSPMSPKIVNGSFAAIYDRDDVIAEFSKTIKLRQDAQNSPAMRRRIKGILMSGKQFSLDSRLDLFHGIEAGTPSSSEGLPPLEDYNESEDNGSTFSGEFDPNEPSDDFLQVPNIPKQKRSKSVDHQVPISMQSDGYTTCKKCGHQIIPIQK